MSKYIDIKRLTSKMVYNTTMELRLFKHSTENVPFNIFIKYPNSFPMTAIKIYKAIKYWMINDSKTGINLGIFSEEDKPKKVAELFLSVLAMHTKCDEFNYCLVKYKEKYFTIKLDGICKPLDMYNKNLKKTHIPRVAWRRSKY